MKELETKLIEHDIDGDNTKLNPEEANLEYYIGDGNTPLHLAAACGQVGIVELLIDYSKKEGISIDIKNNAGQTPLSLAALCGEIDALRALLTAGADIDATDNVGNTPLHLASIGLSCDVFCDKEDNIKMNSNLLTDVE